ncbi:hypothetical protein GW17_00053668 [Ensete ventricosum]|nr:hypothetical protein GW17_00053668 [Ensete ventricosum]
MQGILYQCEISTYEQGCQNADRLLPGGTACYQAVPPKIDRRRLILAVDDRLREKSIADGRLREKSAVDGRLRKKKGRKRRGKEKKEKRGEEIIPSARASSSPVRRRRPRVASTCASLPPVGRQGLLAVAAHVSSHGEKDRGDVLRLDALAYFLKTNYFCTWEL